MANEQEHDRSEPATPFKLEEARRRGQVAKSPEFASWLMLVVAVLMCWIAFAPTVTRTLHLTAALFDQSGHIELSMRSAERLFAATAMFLGSVFGLWLVLLVLSALLSGFVQVGPVFSTHPLKPDFTRLNPIIGFKRVFNARMLYEAAKTFVKLGIVALVLYLFVQSELGKLLGLQQVDAKLHATLLRESVLRLAMMMLAALGLIAVFDLAFVKWEFARKMRMSRRELREEVKRRDGDPKVKAKIRELQREAARRGASLKRVPDADVLVTNPTHLGVAIKYERGKSVAPVVIAKGSGEMALRMRIKAAQARVPIVENRSLARLLFRSVPIDAAVPPESYAEVARLLAWAYRLRARSA